MKAGYNWDQHDMHTFNRSKWNAIYFLKYHQLLGEYMELAGVMRDFYIQWIISDKWPKKITNTG